MKKRWHVTSLRRYTVSLTVAASSQDEPVLQLVQGRTPKDEQMGYLGWIMMDPNISKPIGPLDHWTIGCTNILGGWRGWVSIYQLLGRWPGYQGFDPAIERYSTKVLSSALLRDMFHDFQPRSPKSLVGAVANGCLHSCCKDVCIEAATWGQEFAAHATLRASSCLMQWSETNLTILTWHDLTFRIWIWHDLTVSSPMIANDPVSPSLWDLVSGHDAIDAQLQGKFPWICARRHTARQWKMDGDGPYISSSCYIMLYISYI